MTKKIKQTKKQTRPKKRNKSRKNGWDEPNQFMVTVQYVTQLIKDYV